MKKICIAIVLALLAQQQARAQPVTTKPSLIDMLTANCGAGRAIVGSASGPACSALTFSGSGTVAFGSGGTVLYSGSTAGGELSGTFPNPTINNAPVIAKLLTGFTSAAGTVSAADSILAALQKIDGNVALKAPLASPALTGTPTAPTATPGTNTTQLATTAYADAIAALKANLASPTFTGTPAAPTAAVDTNTTQIATTAMVLGQAASATPLGNAASAVVGTSTRYARADHVHPLVTQPVANGGTGQTTATAAFDALSPNTTRGDLAVRGASNNVRLPLGPTNRVLRSNGTDPSWAQVDLTSDVTSILPTANGGTGNAGGAWTNYTPTITAGAGTITTLGTANGYYEIIGKKMWINLVVNVTTAGTAAADLCATYPSGTARNDTAIPGKEFNVTGKTVNAYSLAGGNVICARYYDGTTVFANGIKVVMTGLVEIN